MSAKLDQAVLEFLGESREALALVEKELVALERGGASGGVAAIFRAVHTIKGTAGFLGFTRVEALAHHGEEVLARLRDGGLVLGREGASALLGMVDVLGRLLASIERDGREGPLDEAPTIEALRGVLGNAPLATRSPPEVAPIEAPAAAETKVRVDVALLDALMALTGELVLVRNQLRALASEAGGAAVLGPLQRLDAIASQLQASVAKTRMQPIGNAWSKLPRLVRELAHVCGRSVRLSMEGSETELDRTILEALRDPITHLVRNAIDHGIEPPSVRVARGKPGEGCVSLRAFHAGGSVTIEVSDDGNGLDWARVARKGVQLGLVAGEQAAAMTERELTELLFRPGFSTAEQVTTVSGRGVGLDVVRTNVEKVAGTIAVESHAGQGTAWRIEIPLTLAIIPALLVTSGGQRYAIPQASVVEVVRADVERGCERVLDAPVYRLRGKLLPLVDLDRELAGDDAPGEPGRASRNVVVLEANDERYGLVVESVVDTAEIVVKPLGRPLEGLELYSGATILADGRVALILDALGLARRARVVGSGRSRRPARSAPAEEGSSRRRDGAESLLVIEVTAGHRAAVPLAAVSRIEEVASGAIERLGGREVVRHRGDVLPVVRVARLLGVDRSASPREVIPVLVHAHPGGALGLAVDQIVDVVEERVGREGRPGRPGVLGTAVIQERVTDLLDLDALVRLAGEREGAR